MLSATVEKELAALRAQLSRKIAAIDEILDVLKSDQEESHPIPRGGRIKAIADAAYPIVEAAGPMRRESILDRLQADGVHIRGNGGVDKKLMTLSSALSKDARFKSHGKGSGLWDIDRDHANRIDDQQDSTTRSIYDDNRESP